MRDTTLACLAAGLLLAAAAAPAAALSLSPANEGIPPGYAGVWVEEREGVDGGPAMVLSRQWLPDGNGFVTYAQVTPRNPWQCSAQPQRPAPSDISAAAHMVPLRWQTTARWPRGLSFG